MAEAQQIDPNLLAQVLALNDDEVILPLKVERKDVNNIRALKISDNEVERLKAFQDYLYDRGYIKENTFTALFIYCFNLAYTQHQQLAVEESKRELKPS
jgi:hypothetical protein